MSTANTIQGEEAIPAKVTQFIKQFYAVLDGNSSQEATEWSKMFDEDGEFVTPVQTFKGRQALKVQREEFWAAYPGLVHQPLRLYVSPSSPLDIVIINSFEFPANDGKRSSYTAATYKLVEKDGTHLIERLELFMDPTVFGWK